MNRMSGIINVIKPPGMSSHQVVSYVRKLLRMDRVGHTGTLDPGASGVLPLCVGKATKLVPFLTDYDKSYIAELTFGIETDTQDASGATTHMDFSVRITPNALGTAFSRFLGKIDQVPPMASAIRIDGVRLYELQRQGLTVERQPRQVEIKELHINKVWPDGPELTFGSRVLFFVRCSKGTYIRTLCHDIGRSLNTCAHMSFLTRIAVGPFTMENAYTLEEIAEHVQKSDFSFLLPMEQALPDYTRVLVSPLVEKRILQGNAIEPKDLVDVPKTLAVGDQVLLMSIDGDLLAIGEIRYKGKLICQPIRVLKEGQ